MATSTITDFVTFPEAVRVSATSATVDVSQYIEGSGNGGFFFLVVARSWYNNNAASSLYMVSGIQNGTYQSCAQILKETYGATMSISGNNLTVTFPNSYGGFYCIIPLYTKMV